jgi:tRNA(Arg) A34 adenosine deaminase TadA
MSDERESAHYKFMGAALRQAQLGLKESGIPIGAVLVHKGKIIGRGRNRRIQKGSPTLHGEIDALENAGRRSAKFYRECVLYTTLSPCSMCSGAILLYGIPTVVVGENRNFKVKRVCYAAVVWMWSCCKIRTALTSCANSFKHIRNCGMRILGNNSRFRSDLISSFKSYLSGLLLHVTKSR